METVVVKLPVDWALEKLRWIKSLLKAVTSRLAIDGLDVSYGGVSEIVEYKEAFCVQASLALACG